jgi:hypothetical protein
MCLADGTNTFTTFKFGYNALHARPETPGTTT